MLHEYKESSSVGGVIQDDQTDTTNTGEGTIVVRDSESEIVMTDDDPDNPKNWSTWYRFWVIGTISFSAWVVVLYSTSYMSCVPGLKSDFGTTNLEVTMGMTTYLTGLAMASLFVAPLSELYGRRVVYLSSICAWTIFIIPCGLAQSFTTILASRFFGGVFAAAMVSNGPGTIVDVSKPDQLALAMSLYSLGPFSGPVLGPLIGGVVFEYAGRQWTNWVVLILGGLSIAMMLTVKETYVPEILRRKTLQMRKKTGDCQWWCQYDREVSGFGSVKLNLSRPVVLFFTEPIILFINVWNAVLYGILYLCFIAYPVVFSQHRGWGPTLSGLSYLGIGIGIVLVIVTEPLIRRVINMWPRDSVTGKPPPEAIAFIMAIGSLLSPIGQFGFAWTGVPARIHWIIPMLFGIPFGAGNTLSFIYSSNYLARAYGIYAASALASNAVIRSLFGATLPLAGSRMYAVLSPQMAGTVCGIMLVAMIPIPFIFWRYGVAIQRRSKIMSKFEP